LKLKIPPRQIIFCNTKDTVHYLSVVLKRFGYDADELSSDLAQGMREKSHGAGCGAGALRFLVATDVAARELIFLICPILFNMNRRKTRRHIFIRAGRTGRMGSSGVAISLVAEMEKFKLQSHCPFL